MSCIYGRRQLGTADQEWVTHIALQMLHDGPLNLFGDDRQVSDILHVDDLIEAMLLAMENIEIVAGKAFNIGGGPDNAVSLREAIECLSDLSEVRPQVHYGPRRKGDQPYYVSDTRNFTAATGWTPRISVEQGMSQLYRWIREDARASCGPAKYGGAAGGIPERADVP
jgi:CDP-paratose 2-epimerase